LFWLSFSLHLRPTYHSPVQKCPEMQKRKPGSIAQPTPASEWLLSRALPGSVDELLPHAVLRVADRPLEVVVVQELEYLPGASRTGLARGLGFTEGRQANVQSV